MSSGASSHFPLKTMAVNLYFFRNCNNCCSTLNLQLVGNLITLAMLKDEQVCKHFSLEILFISLAM